MVGVLVMAIFIDVYSDGADLASRQEAQRLANQLNITVRLFWGKDREMMSIVLPERSATVPDVLPIGTLISLGDTPEENTEVTTIQQILDDGLPQTLEECHKRIREMDEAFHQIDNCPKDECSLCRECVLRVSYGQPIKNKPAKRKHLSVVDDNNPDPSVS